MATWTDLIAMLQGGGAPASAYVASRTDLMTTPALTILNGGAAGPPTVGVPDVPGEVTWDETLCAMAQGGRRRQPMRDQFGRRIFMRSRYVQRGTLVDGQRVYYKVKCPSARPPRHNYASPARRRDALKTLRAMARQASIAIRASKLAARIASMGLPRHHLGGGPRACAPCVKRIPCRVIK